LCSGAAYDALSFCDNQVSIEVNAHQQNPLANASEDRMMPVANFDMQAIASALDFMRIALVPCLTSQAERSMKLLQRSLTGLTDGLEPRGDDAGHGLSEITWPLQAMTTEAKLLAQPVSFEIGSSCQAEGLEDRMTMAGLAARRLQDMLSLAHRVLSISAIIAAQAIDLRGRERLGERLLSVHGRIRELIPEMQPGDPPPASCEELVAAITAGVLAQ
jgi:histidine ammonia-lyase